MKHTNKVIFEIYFGYTTKLEGYPHLITDMNELYETIDENGRALGMKRKKHIRQLYNGGVNIKALKGGRRYANWD